ncbi:DUF4351 domain-containing protein, partial [Microcystis aeruginosa]|uniref:DUF4351 domain-containing protein n=1 Tax=Microcystis aeruginosa TaxID=1126 RepID=UPI001230D26C
RREEAVSLILRLLNRRLGEISSTLSQQIQELSLEQLETLGEAAALIKKNTRLF